MYGAKTAEPIEVPFEKMTQVSPVNHILDGGQDRTNLFAATRATSRRCGLLPNNFKHLLIYVLVVCEIYARL